MAKIFLSHSSQNNREALAMKTWLESQGWRDEVFLDFDPKTGIKIGKRWEDALAQANTQSEALLCLISQDWIASIRCQLEYHIAKNSKKPIFIAQIAPFEVFDKTREWQGVRLFGEGPVTEISLGPQQQPVHFLAEGLARIRLGLLEAGISGTLPENFPWPPENDQTRDPYRGLEPLDVEDAGVYFGRNAEILQGLAELEKMRLEGNSPLFVILGASGTGKSSFLRAGLLPRLKRDERRFFPLDPIRPQTSPLCGERGLARALNTANKTLHLAPVNVGDIKAALREGPERLEQLLRNIQHAARSRLVDLPDDAPAPTLILPVDQAEELFSTDATTEAVEFLTLIGKVLRADPSEAKDSLRDPAPSLIVAFTIRSDRYTPLQISPQLKGLNSVLFDALKPMPITQFKEIIERPADRSTEAGRRLEIGQDLVSRLLDDYREGADTLPLLSLTLALLLREFGNDGDLTLDEYTSIGGIANVIDTEMESILHSNPVQREAQLEALHDAFIPHLAAIDEDTDQPIRRAANLSDFPSESIELIQSLINKRLLLVDKRDGNEIVEVAHESVLRLWTILADWLNDEREDLKLLQTLKREAASAKKNKYGEAWLIKGVRLEAAEILLIKPRYREELREIIDFMIACRSNERQQQENEERHRRAEIEAAQEKERVAEERQAAAEEKQRITELLAEAEKRKVEAELRNAREREVAAETLAAEQTQAAQKLLEGKRQLQSALAGADFREAQQYYKDNNIPYALVHLAHAVRLDPEGVASRSLLVSLLQQRNWCLPVASLTHESGVRSARFSPDGTRVATASYDNTARLWDARTGKALGGAMTHQDSVGSAQFSPDGTRVVTASADRTARLWDARNGKPMGEAMTHQNLVWSAQFSPDGTRVVTASLDKTARLWDARNGKPMGEAMMHQGSVGSAQFSPDGTRVVTASTDNTARLWDARTGKALGAAMTHQDRVVSAQFSPDGAEVVTASADKTARLWHALSGKALGEPMMHQGSVGSAQFSPDGTRVVTASTDRTARLWDGRTGKALGDAMTHQGYVLSAQFSPDGTRVVTASSDKTARIWDVSPIAPHNGHLLLAVLAEAIAGNKLSELGVVETLEDQSGQLNRLREQTANALLGEPSAESFIRWFLSDPWVRTLSPLSRLTVPEYIQQEIANGRGEQVEDEFLGHPMLPPAKVPAQL